MRLAERSDRLGLARVQVAEGWTHDALILLAELAMRTSRIELGTAVISAWGRTPATILNPRRTTAELLPAASRAGATRRYLPGGNDLPAGLPMKRRPFSPATPSWASRPSSARSACRVWRVAARASDA